MFPLLVTGEYGLRVMDIGGGEDECVGEAEASMASAQPGGADRDGLVEGSGRAEGRDDVLSPLVERVIAEAGDTDQDLREHAGRERKRVALGSVLTDGLGSGGV